MLHGRFLVFQSTPQDQDPRVQREVQGAAVSGLEVFNLSLTDHRLLDTSLLKKGRALLQGQARTHTFSVEAGNMYRSLTSKQVWCKIKFVPTALELQVRRLRCYQQIARQPEQHTNVLAAMVGTFLSKRVLP